MRTPSWLLAVQAQAAKERAYLQQSAGFYREKFTKAPGYHEVAMEYGTEPDPGYERDPLVVAAIHRRWPDLVPIWIRWVFKAQDGNEEVFRRHGLARVLSDPHNELVPLPLSIGSLCKKRPHIVEKVFHTPDPMQRYKDLPGPYEPFSWNVFNFVAENYRVNTPEELKKVFLTDEKERLAKAQRAAAEEMEYRDRDVQRFVSKKLEGTSEVEMKEMLLKRYFGKIEGSKKASVEIRRNDA